MELVFLLLVVAAGVLLGRTRAGDATAEDIDELPSDVWDCPARASAVVP